MKTNRILLMVLTCVVIVITNSCNKSDEHTYEALAPVYMSFDDFRQSLKVSTAKSIKQSGKIYFKDNYIFINEVNEGIHVVDNTYPASPQKIAFYEILGNVDMAIRGNILFADSYIDLVAIDISNINQPQEVGRIENAFPHVLPIPLEANLPYDYQQMDQNKGVVVGWKKTTVTDQYYSGRQGWFGRENVMFDMANSTAKGAAGVGGSMARFMLNNQYLLSIAQPYMLQTIDVSAPESMMPVDSISTWREMETLFKYNGNLFVGTTTGMIIYSLEDPAHPEFVSEINHINSCDPVVVEDDIAYVTLRSGNTCMNITNQLDIIDISDIKDPRLLKSYPMFNPHGLGIDNGTLFICDGADGLKVYDASNPLAIQSNKIAHFPGIDTYDVIPLGTILLMIGQDGLFQYDYSDPTNITLLSHIKVEK
jgi:hypothetical protein